MRPFHYITALTILLCLSGFVAAAFLGERQLGMGLFLTGFFMGAILAIFSVLSTNNELGKFEFSIKIIAVGFGLIVFGQLIGFALEKENVLVNILFSTGLIIMFFSIAMAIFRNKN